MRDRREWDFRGKEHGSFERFLAKRVGHCLPPLILFLSFSSPLVSFCMVLDPLNVASPLFEKEKKCSGPGL